MGNRVWRAAHPHQARRIDTRKTLRLKYGISEAQYETFFNKQRGCCAICSVGIVSQFDDSRPFPGRGKRSDVGYVDHCHLANAVRGLLCFNCNVSLGKFKDSEKVLLQAVRYLRESATEQAQPSESRDRFEAKAGRESGTPNELCGRGSRRDELSPFQLT